MTKPKTDTLAWIFAVGNALCLLIGLAAIAHGVAWDWWLFVLNGGASAINFRNIYVDWRSPINE